MITLTTDRLLLRGFEESDAADVYDYARNPKVGPAAGWPTHESVEESQRIVRLFMQENEVWAIVLRDSGRVIGSIGLHRDAKRALPQARMVGYVLNEAYWGQGLVPEAVHAVLRHAFVTLDLPIVSVIHYAFNLQSKRVIEKCGFTYEGTIRMASCLFDGSVHDDVCYSMTKAEYMKRHPTGR